MIDEFERSYVYMSGALSALTKEEFEYVTTEVYDRVARSCEKMGLSCYLPHKSTTTPTKGMPHSKVWEIDYRRVVNSGAIVAYIGKASLGVGAEIEMARTANIPVILLFETSKQEELSRLILGDPAVKFTIPFERPDEIEEAISKPLTLIFSEHSLESVALNEGWSYREEEEARKLVNSMVQVTQKNMASRNFPKRPMTESDWMTLRKKLSRRVTNKGNLDEFS